MRRSPSQAWYAVAAGVVMVAMAAAAFVLGASVRSYLTPIGPLFEGPPTTVRLVEGESRALYEYLEQHVSQTGRTCTVRAWVDGPGAGEAVPLVDEFGTSWNNSSDSEGRWVARYTFVAPRAGQYEISCEGPDWFLAPTFGVDGQETASVVFEWIGRFALIFLPGMVAGIVLAGVIGWRRHRPSEPVG